MECPLFFLEADVQQDMITLSEDTSKHIVQVLRMKQGEKLQLTDGAGVLFTAEIADANKRMCTVSMVNKEFSDKNPKQICIAVSLLKNISRFEWFLEKATELGVAEIIPLLCNRTEKQRFRMERMKHIVTSAMLQSRQVWLPVLRNPEKFDTALLSSFYTTKLIAHCLQEHKSSIADYAASASVQIFIGPEGDFTKQEIEAAIAQNFLPVTLGKTRLRSETAGVVASAVLSVIS